MLLRVRMCGGMKMSHPLSMPWPCAADGDLDLVMTPVYSGSTTLYFENQGSAFAHNFVRNAASPVNGLSNLGGFGSLAAEDIDGDGDADIVIFGNQYADLSDVKLYENTGTPAAPAFTLQASDAHSFYSFDLTLTSVMNMVIPRCVRVLLANPRQMFAVDRRI